MIGPPNLPCPRCGKPVGDLSNRIPCDCTTAAPSAVAVPVDLWRAILDHLIRAPYCDMNPTINPRAAVPADRDPDYWRGACEATQTMGQALYRKAATIPADVADPSHKSGQTA